MIFSRKSEEVLDVSFRTDTPWVVIANQESDDMATRIRNLWKSVKELPVPVFHARDSRRIVISREPDLDQDGGKRLDFFAITGHLEGAFHAFHAM